MLSKSRDRETRGTLHREERESYFRTEKSFLLRRSQRYLEERVKKAVKELGRKRLGSNGRSRAGERKQAASEDGCSRLLLKCSYVNFFEPLMCEKSCQVSEVSAKVRPDSSISAFRREPNSGHSRKDVDQLHAC